jgi:putative transposase
VLWLNWRPVESELVRYHGGFNRYTSEHVQTLLKEQGITFAISRASEVWDNSATESFFRSMKTERTDRRVYCTQEQACANVLGYIERSTTRRGCVRSSGISVQYSLRKLKTVDQSQRNQQ